MLLALWLVIFVPTGLAVWWWGMYLLCWFLDWRCQVCLEREPDNQFCCE